jgi:NADPH:quinone reductase-like Zn-dependent oxidoreductase
LTDRVMMRAMQLAEWGSLDNLKLVDVPRPQPLPTEVLVRVKAAGVNPIDYHTILGRGYAEGLALPYVPGWEVAGIVEQVAYGVTRFDVGDSVYGLCRFPRALGAFAEYVVAPSRQLARKPANISFEQAAGTPLAGLTAYQMLVDVANVKPGMKVLVNGAAGGVGHFAVQIAKALGAEVIGVARKEKHRFVEELGADRVIDYTTSVVTDEVDDADVVLELAGGDTTLQMLKTLRKGGLLLSARKLPETAVIKAEAAKLGVNGSWFICEPDYASLEQLSRLIEQGSLKTEIRTFCRWKAPLKRWRRCRRGARSERRFSR